MKPSMRAPMLGGTVADKSVGSGRCWPPPRRTVSFGAEYQLGMSLGSCARVV